MTAHDEYGAPAGGPVPPGGPYPQGGPVPPGGPVPGAPDRPPIDATRLWAGGLATAVVAALIALVGVLIVRAVLKIALYAPKEAGAFGDGDTIVLCVAAAAAALAATGLVHLLLLATPRPLSYFSWIVGLQTAVAVVMPLLAGIPLAIALAQSVIHLVIGLAIGSLVGGAASSAIRVRRAPYSQRYPVE
jgi:hypothetical protein